MLEPSESDPQSSDKKGLHMNMTEATCIDFPRKVRRSDLGTTLSFKNE